MGFLNRRKEPNERFQFKCAKCSREFIQERKDCEIIEYPIIGNATRTVIKAKCPRCDTTITIQEV